MEQQNCRCYCITCKEITVCTQRRLPDQWTWTCTICGKMADHEFIDQDDYDYDRIEP